VLIVLIPIGVSLLFSLFVVRMVIPKMLASAKLVFLIKKKKFKNMAVTTTRNCVPTVIGQVIPPPPAPEYKLHKTSVANVVISNDVFPEHAKKEQENCVFHLSMQ